MKKVAKLYCSFQQFSVIISTFENTHLMDGNLIQFHQSLGLRHSLLNEHRIDVLHIGKAYKLVDGGVIADVSFEVRIWCRAIVWPSCRTSPHSARPLHLRR